MQCSAREAAGVLQGGDSTYGRRKGALQPMYGRMECNGD